MKNNLSEFSLLYPENFVKENPSEKTNAQKQILWKDLGLDVMLGMFKLHQRDLPFVKEILLELNTDVEVIKYRQDILEDLLKNQDIVSELEGIMPHIEIMIRHHQRFLMKRDEILYDAVSKLNELETYVEVIKRLSILFGDSNEKYKSSGLIKLKKMIDTVKEEEKYKNMVKELPELLDIRQNMTSISVGINLNKSLDPISATLLTINKKPYKGSGFLSKVFGKSSENKDGLATLHVKPPVKEYDHVSKKFEERLSSPVFLDLLFKDLGSVLKDVSKPIVHSVKKYMDTNTSILIKLYYELIFYLGAVRMIKELERLNLPVCKPHIQSMDKRTLVVEDSYNINLIKIISLKNKEISNLKVTLNNIKFDDEGKILILTGPNSGGKTTFIENIGIIHILAQAGLYTPAKKVELSPADKIFTHYQTEEEIGKEAGRLGQESKRFREIFEDITKYSLVIMNESFSSTSEIDSFYISKDIMVFFKLIGCRAIYATHIYELANNINEINNENCGESKIKSIVATVQKNKETNRMEPTFKIVDGEPLGRSFATEVAEDYGISYKQLSEILKDRGIIEEEQDIS